MTNPEPGGLSVNTLLADQSRRWQEDEHVPVEAYLERYPVLRADPEAALDLICNELFLRAERGESPRLEEYLRRFPHLAAELRVQFEIHRALHSAAADPLPPTRPAADAPSGDLSAALPGFQILGVLGHGGMGRVYKAHCEQRGGIVAVKVIRRERLADPDAVRRFRREVQAVFRLDHPNIVRAYDAGEAGGTCFLVMEFVEGTDLGTLMQQTEPLPVAEACDYARQVALALQHACEHGLVHRDVKPSNLLLERPGSRVKVVDFGLARVQATSGEKAGTTLTQPGALMGTPDYIAPEQVADAHAADIRADLYSLGCTLYHLLTGRVPFPGGTAMEKLDRHRGEEPTPVEALRPEVPAPVAAVLRKLMAKQPEDRYPTPADAAEALAATGHFTSSTGHGESKPTL